MNEIYQELGMSEDRTNADVKTIMEWMRKQPHLPNPEGKFIASISREMNNLFTPNRYLKMNIFFTCYVISKYDIMLGKKNTIAYYKKYLYLENTRKR